VRRILDFRYEMNASDQNLTGPQVMFALYKPHGRSRVCSHTASRLICDYTGLMAARTEARPPDRLDGSLRIELQHHLPQP
jgi:hypothetical protein